MSARIRVGLLHTVPSLAGVFHADLATLDPNLEPVHLADAWLLETAIETGVTDAVRAQVTRDLRLLADAGCRAILVTCSSIGDAVDEAAAAIPVPVLRVDRPMAREAVRLAQSRVEERPQAASRNPAEVRGFETNASRSPQPAVRGGFETNASRSPQPVNAPQAASIVVLATLDATLGPTGRLIAAEVAAAGADVSVDAHVVAGAIAARDAGRPEEHDRLIREAVTDAAANADVIVLAQASMARAVGDADLGVPVLTSPAGGMRALLEVAHATSVGEAASGSEAGS
ncbi:hypothetical protein OSC27_11165 [Microbacterium sp. STN6]|uniref:hypothetical protein n=1 Tax=Microbacterium sp. STN6 TaxID=2995588 RepID=UPI0022609661|nr:hypothetical protein [Microbacterium sp. STN6]MCX7522834.1 hypothetical protein [Microbacterium sp. STN6]